MVIYIDGDACPVTQEIVLLAKERELQVKLIKSYAHYSLQRYDSHVQEIYVDSANEAVDYKILAMVQADDLLITQDYGLASLALQKNCQVIHPKGFQYTQININTLLESRYQSAQIRKQGGRTKGPDPYTDEDRKQFKQVMRDTLS
ncbi:YaiI/YqxD family protein [Amphibacillus sp. Q70]|uniref:YaiI/YqxD family protein n=1 Tax=Amphibacillus sp. Q70 TaxID=3453416 RepID=UPI003F8733A7